MHELSIVQSFVSMAEQYAIDNNAKAVKFVTLEIGAMTGVVPHYVRDYYDDVVEGTALEGSELKIEEIPAEAFCKSCGEVFSPTEERHDCPACGKENLEVLHGYELTVKDMGFV